MAQAVETEGKYFRRGLGLKDQVRGQLSEDYNSAVIDRIRAGGNALSEGRLTVRLAKEFGFCYGVDWAVQYAYETVRKFPDRRLFLTSEIIHNPSVNGRLKELGIRFLAMGLSEPSVDEIRPEDVVLIPAFGVPVPLMDRLKARGCVMVDTTCTSVVKVWTRVEEYARAGVTAVVHGKWDHEETRATCSRVTAHPGGRYLVVRDMDEAREVCAYIRAERPAPGAREAFLARFARAASPGFDPDADLARVGLANQTTMLSSDSMAIAEEIRRAIADRYGAASAADRFRSFDTICSATQDRQDAILDLVKEPLDVMLVIGGFASSNTTHLAEIASAKIPTFHIEGPEGLLDARRIRHKPVGLPAAVREGWLPAGSVAVGVTAGASSPNSATGAVIARLFEVANGRPLAL